MTIKVVAAMIILQVLIFQMKPPHGRSGNGVWVLAPVVSHPLLGRMRVCALSQYKYTGVVSRLDDVKREAQSLGAKASIGVIISHSTKASVPDTSHQDSTQQRSWDSSPVHTSCRQASANNALIGLAVSTSTILTYNT